MDGSNTITFYCADIAGKVTTLTRTFTTYLKKFYWVYDNNGTALSTATQYNLGDVNSIYVYSLAKGIYGDMKALGIVSVNYVGDGNDTVKFNIEYTNPSGNIVTTREFDLDVVPSDVNEIAMCFSNLTSFLPQVMYSSQSKDVIMKNANTNCYFHTAATKYGYSDFKALFAYTIPQSYNIFIKDVNATLLTLIDGGAQNTVNLDLLQLKADQDTNISLIPDVLTVSKYCGASADCNTMVIKYRNYMQLNSAITLQIYSGSTSVYSYTDTTNPNDITQYFNFSTWGIEDVNVLSIVATVTRKTGEIKTFTFYFTTKQSTGVFNPWIAIILSFFIFVGGITMVAARFALGYFGLVIALIALILLTFATSHWYVTFFQSIMVIALVFLSLIMKNETARLT